MMHRNKKLDTLTMYLLLLYPLISSSFLFYKFLEVSYVRGFILSSMTCLVAFRVLKSKKVNVINLLWISCVFLWMLLTVDNFVVAFQYVPYFLVLLVAVTEDDWDVFKKFIMLAGLFCAVGIFFQLLFPSLFSSVVLPQFQGYSQFDKIEDTFMDGVSHFGFVSDTSIAARYISFSIAYLLVSLYTKKQTRKILTIVLLVLFGAALLLTGKRTYVGGLIISLLIVYLVSAQGSKKIKRIILLVVILALAAFILPMIDALNNIPAIARLLDVLDSINSGEDFFGYRATLYEKAIAFFKESPLFGIGWRQFRNSVQNEAGYSLNVHNIYLQVLCELGIVGLFVFGFFFVKEYRLAKKRLKESNKRVGITLMILFIQVYFFVCGIAENELYVATGFVYYFISCAFAKQRLSEPIA